VAGARPLFIDEVVEQFLGKRRVEVWFQDEARIGQQGTLTNVWAERGSRPTAVQQTEYEWCYLWAAVHPESGRSSSMITPTVNTELMNQHLKFISEEAGPDVQVVLVLDNAGWHVSKSLVVPENVMLMPLPPYAPELNPIERVWAYLRSHYLSNRVYKDYDELFEKTKTAWLGLDETRLASITETQWTRRAA
jgi:transposase